MNVVRKRKEDLNSDKKLRRRKVSVNEPLDIVIISEEAKTSNVIKDLNNNKENVQIQVPQFTTIQPVQVKKPYFKSQKLIKEVTHFGISVDDSYDADSDYELFTQDIQVNVDEFEKIVDIFNSFEPKDELSAMKVITTSSWIAKEKQKEIFDYWRKNIEGKAKGRPDCVFHQRAEKQAKMGTRGERKREERTKAELYLHALHSRTILKDLLLAYQYYVKYAHRSYTICETHLAKFLDNFERELFANIGLGIIHFVLNFSGIVQETDPEELETLIEATNTFPNYCPTPIKDSHISFI